MGVLFGGETGLYDRLTARENLEYFATLYGLGKHETKVRIGDLAKMFGMKDYLDRKVSGFSKGMRQKVAIARTLIQIQILFSSMNRQPVGHYFLQCIPPACSSVKARRKNDYFFKPHHGRSNVAMRHRCDDA